MSEPLPGPEAREPAPASDAPPLIQARQICKDYEVGGHLLRAVRDVDVDIARGELVSIMGPSGSGKSTFMNLLGALDVPTSGSLRVDGRELSTMHPDELAGLRNTTIGFVFQHFVLLPRTSALENVALPLLYARDSRYDDPLERSRACLERVGLGDRLDHHPSQLSGGQQQRVAIARALVNDPQLILADEPTGALDTRTSVEIMALFQELNAQGITVVLVTHEHDIAAHTARALRFRDGRLVEDLRQEPVPAIPPALAEEPA
ncbi:MAG: ABC transporter ATP-binding protein [Planctomycetota bacterium]